MKNLGVIALAAIAGLYFLGGKSKPSKEEPLTGTREYPGYKIIDCKDLIITDIAQAKQHAIDVGKTLTVSSNASKALFGNSKCLNSLKTGIDNFYELFIHLLIGMDTANKANDLDTILVILNKTAEGLNKKYNLSLKPLTKTEYLQLLSTYEKFQEFPGYVVINCKHLLILNINEARQYAYDVGKKYLTKNNYNEYMSHLVGCNLESLKSGLEDFYNTLYVYSAAGSAKGNVSLASDITKALSDYANDLRKDKVMVTPPTQQEIVSIINTYK